MRGGSVQITQETICRLRAARRVTILTGPGVSAESGVPTFRGPGGLWRGADPGIRAAPQGFPEPPPPGGASCRREGVWFGEGLREEALSEAFRHCARCEVMIVVGTSNTVPPAASLPLMARQAGAWIIEVNPEPPPLSLLANELLRQAAG